jgi:hypothetical protein
VLQGFQEHTVLYIAPYLVVLISVIKIGDAMLLGRALPMEILAILGRLPRGGTPPRHVHAGNRSVVKTYLAVHEAQLPITPRERD